MSLHVTCAIVIALVVIIITIIIVVIIIIIIIIIIIGESSVIARLKNGEQYKFLGVQESQKQEDKLVLNCAAEVLPEESIHDLVKSLVRP